MFRHQGRVGIHRLVYVACSETKKVMMVQGIIYEHCTVYLVHTSFDQPAFARHLQNLGHGMEGCLSNASRKQDSSFFPAHSLSAEGLSGPLLNPPSPHNH